MKIRDRFFRGFTAGVLATVPFAIADHIAVALGLAEIYIHDWVAALVFGYLAGAGPLDELFGVGAGVEGAGGFSAVVADLGNLLWNGVLGIGFVYLLLVIGERYRVLKGLLYALTAWFVFYALSGLFQVAVLLPLAPQTVVTNGVLAAAWGVTMAWLVGYFYIEEA